MSGTIRAIGMMSGTSMDGVDAAIIETDGVGIQSFGPTFFREYSTIERAAIAAAVGYAAGADLSDKSWLEDSIVHAATEIVTIAHQQTIESILKESKLTDSDIDIIGFHGQTIIHRPEISLTVQLGDGQALADQTGIDVVFDLRAADIAGGGQGAPLAPVYHRALVDMYSFRKPVAVLNIGGIANVTWIGEDDTMIAFDTGPGNVLLDEWMLAKTGIAMDEGGKVAAKGQVDANILAELLDNPFFHARPPKSLDRLDFSPKPVESLSLEDGAATLTAFTAGSIARAADHFPTPANDWIVTGGGALNPVLMAALAATLPGNVAAASDLGWSDTFIEAQAFGYMAVRSIKELPLTYPATTGIDRPLSGGVLAKAVRR